MCVVTCQLPSQLPVGLKEVWSRFLVTCVHKIVEVTSGKPFVVELVTTPPFFPSFPSPVPNILSFSLSSPAFQTEGKLYLVLEFLRGGDLFTRLSKEVGRGGGGGGVLLSTALYIYDGVPG